MLERVVLIEPFALDSPPFTSSGLGTIDRDTMMADQSPASVYRDRCLGLQLFNIAEIATGLALAVGTARGLSAARRDSVVLTLSLTVSTVWTLASVDLGAFFDAMRRAPERAQIFEALAEIGRAPAVVFWLAVWVLFLIYLMGLRPRFQPQESTEHD